MASDNNSNNNESKENDDGIMTMQEREQWLRDRGVQIETSESRRSGDLGGGDGGILSQMSRLHMVEEEEEEDSEQQQQQGSVQFVCVPWDSSKPMRTLMLPPPASSSSSESQTAVAAGDRLVDFVCPHFADNKAIDPELLQQQATKHFAGGNLQQLADTKISASAMNSVASQGSVETFPLVRPADTNNYTGVYIYLDEVGLLKRLPDNPRASAIAAACGYDPPPHFCGDVFIGRVRTKPGPMINANFCVGPDTDKGAPWIRRAVSENLAWQQEMNRVTGKGNRVTQPPVVGTDGTAAKEDGFTWTQEEEEIELKVSLAPNSINKKAVKVNFRRRGFTVYYENKERLKIGTLYGDIDVDACTWTIDGTNLVITCEKGGGSMWPRLTQEASTS